MKYLDDLKKYPVQKKRGPIAFLLFLNTAMAFPFTLYRIWNYLFRVYVYKHRMMEMSTNMYWGVLAGLC